MLFLISTHVPSGVTELVRFYPSGQTTRTTVAEDTKLIATRDSAYLLKTVACGYSLTKLYGDYAPGLSLSPVEWSPVRDTPKIVTDGHSMYIIMADHINSDVAILRVDIQTAKYTKIASVVQPIPKRRGKNHTVQNPIIVRVALDGNTVWIVHRPESTVTCLDPNTRSISANLLDESLVTVHRGTLRVYNYGMYYEYTLAGELCYTCNAPYEGCVLHVTDGIYVIGSGGQITIIDYDLECKKCAVNSTTYAEYYTEIDTSELDMVTSICFS